MLKWGLLLIIIVFVLGYIHSRRAKKEREEKEENFAGCGGGCAGCMDKGLCSENRNNEKK